MGTSEEDPLWGERKRATGVSRAKTKKFVFLAIKEVPSDHKVTLHVATVKRAIKIRSAFTSIFPGSSTVPPAASVRSDRES